jgi:hypothetical protein
MVRKDTGIDLTKKIITHKFSFNSLDVEYDNRDDSSNFKSKNIF